MQWQWYMATNVSINTDIISVCQGIWSDAGHEQVPFEDALPLLQERWSGGALRGHRIYPLKMCTHILVAISSKLNTAYYVRSRNSLATNVNLLILRLEVAILNIKQIKGMTRQHVNSKLGNWEI